MAPANAGALVTALALVPGAAFLLVVAIVNDPGSGSVLAGANSSAGALAAGFANHPILGVAAALAIAVALFIAPVSAMALAAARTFAMARALLAFRALSTAPALALVAGLFAVPALAEGLPRQFELRVETGDDAEILSLSIGEGDQWCLLWTHSVAGFEVEDCFEIREGEMRLMRSRQPDFAAGLGHIPGRGELTSEAGGYLIEGIDEPLRGNCLPIRLGSMAVDHRLTLHDTHISLSARAERQRARIVLVDAANQGYLRC